jgi:hypothetical protein
MNIQPADIVIVHNLGFNFLRLWTGMYWNHLFIIDQRVWKDWGILESIGKGTAPGLLSMYEGAELAVYRYRGITHQQQMKVLTKSREMGRLHYDIFIPFRILWRLGLVKFIKTFIKLLSHQYPLEIPHKADDYVVCSEYGQESYSRAGIPIIEDKYLLFPDDVARCPSLELVWRGVYSTVEIPNPDTGTNVSQDTQNQSEEPSL